MPETTPSPRTLVHLKTTTLMAHLGDPLRCGDHLREYLTL